MFGSVEYPEFSNSIYDNSVGVWINDTHVPLSIAEGDTAINTVAKTNNINLYDDNTPDQFNTEMDGFTLSMMLTVSVNVDDTIMLPTGQLVNLLVDSKLDITTDRDFKTLSFIYQIKSTDAASNGVEDNIGIVTVETIRCFVASTMIKNQMAPAQLRRWWRMIWSIHATMAPNRCAGSAHDQ